MLFHSGQERVEPSIRLKSPPKGGVFCALSFPFSQRFLHISIRISYFVTVAYGMLTVLQREFLEYKKEILPEGPMARIPGGKISNRTVARLSVEGRDAVFWDRDLPGFGVRVYPSGIERYDDQTHL